MSTVTLVAVTLAVVVLSVGAGLAVRRRIGRTPERDRLGALTRRLGWADRWRVYRAVVKGRAVTDPALAPAVVARARYTRACGRRVTGGRQRWALPAVGALQLVVAAARLLTPGTDRPRAVGVASSLVLAAVLFTVPAQWRFYARRADRAERLNRPLLPPGTPAQD